MKNKLHLPFWLFTYGCIAALVLSVLVQDGMFMDAVLYSSVAHNESIGIGTFWFPRYNALGIAGIPTFHEQPPLVFGIVSLFYRVFGESMYVERFYTFATMIVTMLLMRGIWRRMYQEQPSNKAYFWVAVCLWVATPCVYWAYSNNMCENTMAIFALGSVLVSYKALLTGNRSILPYIVSGVLIFLATFCKGFPAFFPIGVPLLYYFIVKSGNLRRTFFHTFLLASVPLSIYGILFCIPTSRESLSIYLFKRAFHRMLNTPTVGSRLEIFQFILADLVVPITIMVIIYLVARKQKLAHLVNRHNRQAWFFVAVGLSASCPLALTLVQKGFYLTPCYPYFAIGFATLILPIITKWVGAIDIKGKAFNTFLIVNVAYLCLSFVFVGWRYGQVNRAEDVIHDVYLIRKEVPKFSVVTVPPKMYDEYDFILPGYLMRYDNISIDPYKEYDYFLIEKGMESPIPPNYTKISLATIKYDLYKRGTSIQ